MNVIETFSKLYKGKRLLAINSNTEYHSVIYDSGNKESKIYDESCFKDDSFRNNRITDRAHKLLNDLEYVDKKVTYIKSFER